MSRKNIIFLLAVLCICIVFLLNFRFVLTAGRSMEPTYPPGTLLLCMRQYAPVETGSVVLILQDNTQIIKRVSAQAGEEVLCADVNDPQQAVYYSYWDTETPAAVPNGYLFVAGDNPAESFDSRYPEFGLVPIDRVWGTVLCRIPTNLQSLLEIFTQITP